MVMDWEDVERAGKSSRVSVIVGKRGGESNNLLRFMLQQEERHKIIRIFFKNYKCKVVKIVKL